MNGWWKAKQITLYFAGVQNAIKQEMRTEAAATVSAQSYETLIWFHIGASEEAQDNHYRLTVMNWIGIWNAFVVFNRKTTSDCEMRQVVVVAFGLMAIPFGAACAHVAPAKNPNLYVLTCKLLRKGLPLETVTQRFGFRTTEVKGKEPFINGRPVKLRGMNRHQVSPSTWRSMPKVAANVRLKLVSAKSHNF